MKKIYLPAHRAIALLFSILLTNCVKSPIIIPGQKHYEITQLTGESTAGWTDSIQISYNSFHDPIQIAGQHISTGYPQYLFGYDARHALRILIGAYYDGNPGYEVAHKYLCDQRKRVILDSVFEFGNYDRNTLTLLNSYLLLSFKKYVYDNQDRITQVTEERFPGTSYTETHTTAFFYNSSGNAYKIHFMVKYSDNSIFSSDAFPAYDNKVNPHQLHPVWQFIDIDYNKNNAFTADWYNDYGLPLHISTGNKFSEIVFLLNSFKSLEITYEYR
ncbi:hypothetical protein [Chitinophaga sp.]|uniref:hypothetical protein n=1 Tax=Chitinophaga sp. TaxID=1869181 RepID=UPI002F9227AE